MTKLTGAVRNKANVRRNRVYTNSPGNNIHPFHWPVQNVMIPCCFQKLLPFLSVTYFSCHPSPPTIIRSSLTSSCRLFLGLPLNLVVPKFIHNTLLGILFPPNLCTCPNQRNLFNLIVSIIVGFLTLAWISLLVNILQFPFSLSHRGPKILLYTFLSKMFNCFLSLFVSVPVSDAHVNVLCIVVLFSVNFSLFDMFLLLKNFVA